MRKLHRHLQRGEFYALALKMGKATPTERKAISEESGVIVAKLCGPQAAALTEARKRFGAKAFDRFLYRAVAPSMFKVMLSEDPEWEVQTAEEGRRLS